ncbi:MAG: transglutaminase-like cysteine peptidase [Pseudomonadota bacterium]|nr:transglutaminase-like cysteine peptidase [Pseudomonadota bacterium]
MLKSFLAAAVAAALFGAVFANFSEASEAGLPHSSFAAVGEATSVPYGWVDFCGRRPEECELGKLKPLDVKMTKAAWAQLTRINKRVNDAIEPMTNLAHWGTTLDHWDYPVDGKGDCKVYALYKRKLLIDAGFPRQALLMTVVRDLEGEGHAILTVKTDRGEFVLDNLTDEIRPWNTNGYTYIKRQAQDDPNVWLDLGGVRGQPGNTVARAD